VIDKKKVFLASSGELAGDRQAFEIFVGRKNKDWIDKGIFIELIVWEDFLDALAPARLQDEYNRAIRECDLFVMLFWTKVGRYTEEEFSTAFGQFQATRKPFIFTYFKEAPTPGGTDPANTASLGAFKARLDRLGHFYTRYSNTESLQLHFSRQLDKLVDTGFIEFKPDRDEAESVGGVRYEATVHGSGAAAAAPGAKATGERGVIVEGNNSGILNTGTLYQSGGGAIIGGGVNTGGGNFAGRDHVTTSTYFSQGLSGADLESLFTRLLAEVAQRAPVARKAEAVRQVQQLKAEAAKGDKADDGVLARIVNGLADLVPEAVGTVVSLFATPILSGIAGPVTKIVLDKLKGG
jgi:hypothetical protein